MAGMTPQIPLRPWFPLACSLLFALLLGPPSGISSPLSSLAPPLLIQSARVWSHMEMVDERVLLAGLVGAIIWNLITLTLGSAHEFFSRLNGWIWWRGGGLRWLQSARFSVDGKCRYYSFSFLLSSAWWWRILVRIVTTWIVRRSAAEASGPLVPAAATAVRRWL